MILPGIKLEKFDFFYGVDLSNCSILRCV